MYTKKTQNVILKESQKSLLELKKKISVVDNYYNSFQLCFIFAYISKPFVINFFSQKDKKNLEKNLQNSSKKSCQLKNVQKKF